MDLLSLCALARADRVETGAAEQTKTKPFVGADKWHAQINAPELTNAHTNTLTHTRMHSEARPTPSGCVTFARARVPIRRGPESG